jgi:Transposase DDE domain/SWIM zinc finger
MDMREAKALELAARARIREVGVNKYVVPSQSGNGFYTLGYDGDGVMVCDCPDFTLRRPKPCKHVLALLLAFEQEEPTSDPLPGAGSTESAPKPKRKTYPQDWPNYNLAQNREKDHVQDLLADLCRGIPEPPPKGGSKGGRPAVPLASQAFAACYKVYCGMSARRFICDLQAAHERGCIPATLSHNSVINAMDNPALTPILMSLIRTSALPLRAVDTRFAVDSSGFCTSRFIRWFDIKYGVTREKAEWVKVHICTGVKTNVITSVEILGKDVNDCPQFRPLVTATAEQGFTVDEVSADLAYASEDNFQAVEEVGATPYIPFKSNATGGIGGLFEKAFHYFNLHREEFLAHYHQRSNVESTFSAVKRKMGDSIRSKTDTAMKNEALCKLLAHNVCCLVSAMYELGIVPVFWHDEDGGPRDVLPLIRRG